MADKQKIVDRIAKLMALADLGKNNNVQEAAAAAAKVEQLLIEYNLELADVLAHTEPGTGQRQICTIVLNLFSYGEKNPFQMRLWRLGLAGSIAKYTFCKVFQVGSDKLIFFGRKVDIGVAEQLYISLTNQIEAMCLQATKAAEQEGRIKSNWPGTRNTQTWKYSWLISCAGTVADRLEQMWLSQLQPDTKALVALTDTDIDKYVSDLFGDNLGMSRTKLNKNLSLDGYLSGKEAGKHVVITTGVTAPPPKNTLLR